MALLECFSTEESAKWYVEIKDHHDSTKRIGCDSTFALLRCSCFVVRSGREHRGGLLTKGVCAMSLFRKQTVRYVDANGKRVTKAMPDATKVKIRSKVWSARYRDADGIVREVKLFRDKTASQQKLNELVRKSELGKAGLVNPHEQHAKTPLAEHLDQFIADLRNRGRTVAHVDLIETRVRSLIGKSKAKFIGDLSASHKTPTPLHDILFWLHEWLHARMRKRGFR